MNRTQKCLSLFCAMMMVGVIAIPSQAAISFSASKKLQPKKATITRYMNTSNPELKRAIKIHNLMNEMPDLVEAMKTEKDLANQKSVVSQAMEAMTGCHSEKLGDVFTDPKKTWGKMVDAYEKKRQVPEQEKSVQNSYLNAGKKQAEDNKKNMKISRDIMMDVYGNPSKWGQTKPGSSFPLWQDQVTLFEKQWNDFYNKMNAAFGVPLSGRPQVDEKTRQNAQQYETVLKAHKAYLSSLQSKKNMAYKDLPPKAPAPLPQLSEMLYVDPKTNQVYPEMPEIWKDETTRQALVKANPNSELARVFKGGNTSTPSEFAPSAPGSILEDEYMMRLALDSVEKGYISVNGTTSNMQQQFAKKLADVGVDATGVNLSNKGQYLKIQKQLKAEKKKAVAAAQKYVDLLEKQDAEHPELVQNRQKLQAQKQARLSERAQAELEQSDDGIVQISQMSPVMQQKFVISALEKDENALVYLTETNAMDIDQMMRERQATNKVIAESQKQMETIYDQQLKSMPEMTSCSNF